MIHTWGAEVVASPSTDTKAGRDALAKNPNSQAVLVLQSVKQ